MQVNSTLIFGGGSGTFSVKLVKNVINKVVETEIIDNVSSVSVLNDCYLLFLKDGFRSLPFSAVISIENLKEEGK